MYIYIQCTFNINRLPQDFFDNIDKWREKRQVLIESSNYLMETVEEPVAAEIKEQVLVITRRWQDVLDEYENRIRRETVDRSRRDYRDGVEHMTKWLDNVEGILKEQPECDHQQVKELLQLLDVSIQSIGLCTARL